MAAKFHEEAGVFKLLVSITIPLCIAILVLATMSIYRLEQRGQFTGKVQGDTQHKVEATMNSTMQCMNLKSAFFF